MSIDSIRAGDPASVLREAFDRAFAQAPSESAAVLERLLEISVGSDRYVVRLAELSGFFTNSKITRLPSPVSELIGIGGILGRVLPVYDLGMLLGYPRTAAPRGVAVTAHPQVGLACHGFAGYISAPQGSIVPAEIRATTGRRHVREVLQGESPRLVIDLTSVLETIQQRISSGSQTRGSGEERI
jgi:chemotaxis signal transduction protein